MKMLFDENFGFDFCFNKYANNFDSFYENGNRYVIINFRKISTFSYRNYLTAALCEDFDKLLNLPEDTVLSDAELDLQDECYCKYINCVIGQRLSLLPYMVNCLLCALCAYVAFLYIPGILSININHICCALMLANLEAFEKCDKLFELKKKGLFIRLR